MPRKEEQACRPTRTKITSACVACRRRRRRCLGGRPCPPCALLSTPCTYDEGLDRRRKVYTERARAEVDFQRRLLDSLLHAIRGDDCEKVLNMIRANGSLQDLAAQLDLLDDTRDAICHEADTDMKQNSPDAVQSPSDELSLASCSLLPSSASLPTSQVMGHYLKRCESYCTSEGRQEDDEERLPSFSELIASTHNVDAYELEDA